MAEMPNVIPNEIIEADWGNAIRDRTLQRYGNTATRDAENAAPADGELAFLEDSGDVQVYFQNAWRNLVPTGVILPYGGTSAPPGYLSCTGQAVSRTTYAGLFAVIGTRFGAGDGSTTFNVPDLRQRFPRGANNTSNIGGTGGSTTHTHNVNPPNTSTSQNGAHTHTVNPPNTSTSSNGAHTHTVTQTGTPNNTGTFWNPPDGVQQISFAAANHRHDGGTAQSNGAHQHTVDIPQFTSGSNGAHTHTVDIAAFTSGGANHLPPYVDVNFIIKT